MRLEEQGPLVRGTLTSPSQLRVRHIKSLRSIFTQMLSSSSSSSAGKAWAGGAGGGGVRKEKLGR